MTARASGDLLPVTPASAASGLSDSPSPDGEVPRDAGAGAASPAAPLSVDATVDTRKPPSSASPAAVASSPPVVVPGSAIDPNSPSQAEYQTVASIVDPSKLSTPHGGATASPAVTGLIPVATTALASEASAAPPAPPSDPFDALLGSLLRDTRPADATMQTPSMTPRPAPSPLATADDEATVSPAVPPKAPAVPFRSVQPPQPAVTKTPLRVDPQPLIPHTPDGNPLKSPTPQTPQMSPSFHRRGSAASEERPPRYGAKLVDLDESPSAPVSASMSVPGASSASSASLTSSTASKLLADPPSGSDDAGGRPPSPPAAAPGSVPAAPVASAAAAPLPPTTTASRGFGLSLAFGLSRLTTGNSLRGTAQAPAAVASGSTLSTTATASTATSARQGHSGGRSTANGSSAPSRLSIANAHEASAVLAGPVSLDAVVNTYHAYPDSEDSDNDAFLPASASFQQGDRGDLVGQLGDGPDTAKHDVNRLKSEKPTTSSSATTMAAASTTSTAGGGGGGKAASRSGSTSNSMSLKRLNLLTRDLSSSGGYDGGSSSTMATAVAGTMATTPQGSTDAAFATPQRSTSEVMSEFHHPPSGDSGPGSGHPSGIGRSISQPLAPSNFQKDWLTSVPSHDDIPLANQKRNKDFHELFPSLPLWDSLVEDYSCAWQKEILCHGRMYLSRNHVSFYANILGWQHHLTLALRDLAKIEKKVIAAVVPNSLELTSLDGDKYFFASFMNRDATYTLLMTLWRAEWNQPIALTTFHPRPSRADPNVEERIAVRQDTPGGNIRSYPTTARPSSARLDNIVGFGPDGRDISGRQIYSRPGTPPTRSHGTRSAASGGGSGVPADTDEDGSVRSPSKTASFMINRSLCSPPYDHGLSALGLSGPASAGPPGSSSSGPLAPPSNLAPPSLTAGEIESSDLGDGVAESDGVRGARAAMPTATTPLSFSDRTMSLIHGASQSLKLVTGGGGGSAKSGGLSATTATHPGGRGGEFGDAGSPRSGRALSPTVHRFDDVRRSARPRSTSPHRADDVAAVADDLAADGSPSSSLRVAQQLRSPSFRDVSSLASVGLQQLAKGLTPKRRSMSSASGSRPASTSQLDMLHGRGGAAAVTAAAAATAMAVSPNGSDGGLRSAHSMSDLGMILHPQSGTELRGRLPHGTAALDRTHGRGRSPSPAPDAQTGQHAGSGAGERHSGDSGSSDDGRPPPYVIRQRMPVDRTKLREGVKHSPSSAGSGSAAAAAAEATPVPLPPPAAPVLDTATPVVCDCLVEGYTKILDVTLPCRLPWLWAIGNSERAWRGAWGAYLARDHRVSHLVTLPWGPPTALLTSAAMEALQEAVATGKAPAPAPCAPTPASEASPLSLDVDASYDAIAAQHQRRVGYTIGLTGTFGPKQTRTFTVETVVAKDAHRRLCMRSETTTPDVPSGSAFHTVARTCLTQAGHHQTRWQVHMQLVFTGSSWFRKPIERAVPDAMTKQYQAYAAYLETLLRQQSPPDAFWTLPPCMPATAAPTAGDPLFAERRSAPRDAATTAAAGAQLGVGGPGRAAAPPADRGPPPVPSHAVLEPLSGGLAATSLPLPVHGLRARGASDASQRADSITQPAHATPFNVDVWLGRPPASSSSAAAAAAAAAAAGSGAVLLPTSGVDAKGRAYGLMSAETATAARVLVAAIMDHPMLVAAVVTALVAVLVAPWIAVARLQSQAVHLERVMGDVLAIVRSLQQAAPSMRASTPSPGLS
ncbi:hypothetical protein CXG81DRAFT_18282 [Caulochytrium protostelioides]|uniref:VASt domain-containing protein n=1 Tax=Caulochytrium protostelioides TaxID=1555241 RepID=A0A4V1IUW6_9FUNG|nr:hypothetical protein CXG81DRAFT_18282 [Caulochytrium protostelioides]|eukprot:RKP01989.1 hypothetical protein CXG81DRAFT_18282 [Caulochytrium protostelioides]